MQNARIYTVQILGIVLLLCGYLVGNQPDSLSVMHFDSNPECPAVISKAIKSTVKRDNTQKESTHHNKHPRKISQPRHLSVALMLSQHELCGFYEIVEGGYTQALPETYSYLFFEEINPPPPKLG